MNKYLVGGLVAAGLFYYGMCNNAERMAVRGIVKRSYDHSKKAIRDFLDKQHNSQDSYNPNADEYQHKFNNSFEEKTFGKKGKKEKIKVMIDDKVFMEYLV